MGRPSIRSWTDPPFEPNASIVRPDPTLLTKRFRTSQKRPPLYQAYGDGQKPTTVFEKRWDARPSLREMCRRGLVIGATRGLVASDGTRSRNAPDTFGRKSIPGTWRLSDLPFAGSTVQKSEVPCVRPERVRAHDVPGRTRHSGNLGASSQMPLPPLGACRFRGLSHLVTCPSPVERLNLRGERTSRGNKRG